MKEEQAWTYRVVFVRHGQSIWNKQSKFSGWVDVPLNETGEREAR
jgi:2,3-bisphosphoglycerate-dependent phosphoglycerate mutase